MITDKDRSKAGVGHALEALFSVFRNVGKGRFAAAEMDQRVCRWFVDKAGVIAGVATVEPGAVVWR